MSLDVLLGLVGGLSAVVFGALNLFLGSYQQFKYENSLIGSIYSTAPGDDNDEVPKSEIKAQNELMNKVAERGKYFYSIREYAYFMPVVLLCSCCCKNKKWYK